MSRQGDRRGHDTEVRVSWLEDDMDRVEREFSEVDKKIEHKYGNSTAAIQLVSREIDKLESKLEEIKKESDAKVEQVKKEAAEEISGNRKVMVGVLLSTLGVAIAIVAQVLTMGGGG